MASYQAIETKLRQLEDKVDFVMKSFTIQKKEPSFLNPGTFKVTNMTLAQLYRELNSLGAEVLDELTAEASQDALGSIEGSTQADPLPTSVGAA